MVKIKSHKVFSVPLSLSLFDGHVDKRQSHVTILWPPTLAFGLPQWSLEGLQIWQDFIIASIDKYSTEIKSWVYTWKRVKSNFTHPVLSSTKDES